MSKQKAINITITSRKPQDSEQMLSNDFYFRPDKKVKLGNIERDKDCVIDGRGLLCEIARGYKGVFWKWGE